MTICASNLPILFGRMEWPNLLVRERAASQIVALLKNRETCQVTGSAFIDWLASRTLESFAANALLIPLRLKADGDEVIPHVDAYDAAIKCPSVLSQLLFNEIRGDEIGPMTWTHWHSGSAPVSTPPDPYFEQYKRSFVPEIYDLRAGQIERDFTIPFRRQWAYEYRCLMERTGFSHFGSFFNFLRAPSKDARVLCDVPQSEVFRSAFLRAIAWAVDIAGLQEDLAKVLALKSCPLDIGCWKIEPTAKPNWWPHAQQTVATLDISSGEVLRQVEILWRQQHNSDTSAMLVHASGHIFADETAISDLEILGAFQKFTGDADPTLEEVTEWLTTDHTIMPDRLAPSFEGNIEPVSLTEHIQQCAGWSLAPAAFRLNSWSTPRWQVDRMLRGVWVPAPYFLPDGCSMLASPEMLGIFCANRIIARWTTWNDHLSDTWYRHIPPAVGECLWVDRDVVTRFCAQHKANFCWIIRQRFYHRQYAYDTFEKVTMCHALGITHIVR